MSPPPKKGLGKGLGALIPSETVLTAGRTVMNIDIDHIVPNPRQPRADMVNLEDLAASIKEKGIAQPVIVRRVGDKYELVAGERRWRAAKKAGFKSIPAITRAYTDEDSLEIALIENIQREDLNAMEEAEAYAKLSQEFNLTQDEIAKKVGKNRSTVANTLRLLELPDPIQKSIRKGELTAGHARPLLSLSSAEEQLSVWQEIIKNKLSVRDVEQVTKSTLPKKKKTKPVTNYEMANIEDRLTSTLGTKVRVHGNRTRGRIDIDYYSQEDLERLIELFEKK